MYIMYVCIYICFMIHSLFQQNSSDHVSDMAAVQLDSLDGLRSTQLEVVPSHHDQTISLMLSLPQGRIWNCTVIAYCRFLTFELSEYTILKRILYS